MTTINQVPETRRFFLAACGFEAGLGLLAFAIAWWLGIAPMASIIFTWTAVITGLLGAVPIFILFWILYRYPSAGLLKIKTFLNTLLAPHLSVCNGWQLLLLAMLAGVGEELLFRGVFQPWMETVSGLIAGLIVSNILFGFAHCITFLYAVLAAGMGVYLGCLLDIGEQRNLLIPIITHGVYDFLAFLLVVREYRAEKESQI